LVSALYLNENKCTITMEIERGRLCATYLDNVGCIFEHG
jgi:hypothetical protein